MSTSLRIKGTVKNETYHSVSARYRLSWLYYLTVPGTNANYPTQIHPLANLHRTAHVHSRPAPHNYTINNTRDEHTNHHPGCLYYQLPGSQRTIIHNR